MATINLGAIKFNWKGAYNSGTSYAVDDVVSSGGNSYVCIQAHSNQAVGNATAYWNIMSSAGTNGTDGTDVGATLANKEIAFKTNAGAVDGIPIGTAGQVLKVNSGATGYEYGSAGGVLACYYDNWNNQYSASGTTKQVIYTSANRTLASTSSKMLIEAHISLGGQSYGGSVGMEYSTDNGSSWTSITTQAMQDTDDNQLADKAMIGLHLNMNSGDGSGFMAQDSFIHLHLSKQYTS